MDCETNQKSSLLLRLAYVVVRSYQSRARHYSAAEYRKKIFNSLNILLICFSAITTAGIFSLLSEPAFQTFFLIENSFLSFTIIVQLVSALFAALTTILSVLMASLNLEEQSIKHEKAGHDYTMLRDEAIAIAHKVALKFNSEYENEVYRLEQECNSLAHSSPMIPPKIHARINEREKNKRIIQEGYWLRRFMNPKCFADDFLAESDGLMMHANNESKRFKEQE